MYKKCVQLVEEQWQNTVQTFPHFAPNSRFIPFTIKDIHDLMNIMQALPTQEPQLLHTVKRKINRYKSSLCTLSTQPITTTTMYISKNRNNKELTI